MAIKVQAKARCLPWLTGVSADPAKIHEAQFAMAPVPESRRDDLWGVNNPKKVTRASLELVDTPGLSRDNEGNAARLSLIRDAGCQVQVVAAFDGAVPRAEGAKTSDRDEFLRAILDAPGQMLFFTAGEKEVRTWMIRQGGTALEAADGIHSDLARGFIRAEVMPYADLVRLGSERELKAANLVWQEPKDYVFQDGDILNIKFSASFASHC